MMCLSSIKVHDDVWIVDSNASDHITLKGILSNLWSLNTSFSVLLSNGHRVPVTNASDSAFSNKIKLCAVHLVPMTKFHLISLGRLTADPGLIVKFIDK